MTSLPIIQRELLVRGRSRATYWLRLAAAFAGLLICSHQLMLAGTFLMPAELGRSVFNELVGAAFLLCCGAALVAADVISVERRDGTLGLLFLTRVKGSDVLLGKLVSVGLTSLCALIAFLPALMVPVLVGGIGPDEAFREALALLVILLFALSAGLFGSAPHWERLKAVRAAVLIVLLVVLGPYLFYRLAFGRALGWLGCLSPAVLLQAAQEADYTAMPAYYWVSLLVVGALAWFLLMAAGVRLRRPVREEKVVAASPAEKLKVEERALGLVRWQPGKEEAPPVEWLVYRQGGVSAWVWVLGVVGLLCSRWMALLVQNLKGRGAADFSLIAWPLGIAGALAGGGMVASVASRFFTSVRHTGELELLLTTPLGAATVVSDQWKVLKRVFVWPLVFLELATLVPALALFMVPAVLNVVNTALGAAALCWLSLWFGLKGRTRWAAIIWSVTLAQGVPWLLNLIFWKIPGLPDLVLLGFYGWIIVQTRRHLLRDLAGVEPMPFKFAAELGLGTTELEMAK